PPALSPGPSLASLTRLSPSSTLFPYTTLFRSRRTPQVTLLLEPHVLAPQLAQLVTLIGGQAAVALRRSTWSWRRQFLSVCWDTPDRKSTRLNSSHEWISYAVFCLKKNKSAPAE